MTVGTLYAAAESADGVLLAGRKLYDGLADPERADFAAAQLADRLEAGVDHVALSRQGFDSDGVVAEAESLDEALVLIAGELDMANVALAADGVIAGRQQPDDLDAALNNLSGTNAELRAALSPPVAQGFDAEQTRSADLPTAIAAIRAAAESTVDQIAARGGELAKTVLASLPELAPKIKDAWDEVKKRLNLDVLGDQVGRFAKIALRLLASALDRLARLIPAKFVAATRDSVQNLATRLDAHEPAVAAFGWAVGVEGLKKTTAERLGRDGLEVSKLDRGTDLLGALATRHERYMGIASGVTAALGLFHRFSGLLLPIAAQVAVVTVSAHLLVLIAVVTISADFLDTGTNIGVVRGARLIIQEATG